MKVEEPDMTGTYTYADYMNRWWEERVELIKGKIYKMSPAPRSSHQRVAGELYLQMANFLKKNARCSLPHLMSAFPIHPKKATRIFKLWFSLISV